MTALSQGLEVRPAASRVVGVCLVAVGGIMWLVVPLMYTYVVPRFVHIFQEYGAALPAVTVILIQACRWLAEY